MIWMLKNLEMHSLSWHCSNASIINTNTTGVLKGKGIPYMEDYLGPSHFNKLIIRCQAKHIIRFSLPHSSTPNATFISNSAIISISIYSYMVFIHWIDSFGFHSNLDYSFEKRFAEKASIYPSLSLKCRFQ